MTKKSDIGISESNGYYNVVIGNVCVTEPFKTKDAAYKDYIKQLMDANEQAQKWLSSVKMW